MNNMKQMLEWSIRSRGELSAVDPADLQRLLNDTPFNAINYYNPITRMRLYLDEI